MSHPKKESLHKKYRNSENLLSINDLGDCV